MVADQVVLAVKKLKELFGDLPPQQESMPEGATVDSLWQEILALKSELASFKKTKRGLRPTIEAQVKLLVTDLELNELPIPLIAEIVREVNKIYGINCACSESSVRWYISQRSMQWTVVRRVTPKVETKIDDALNSD